MSEKKENISHFKRPVTEITVDEIENMSHLDRVQYIIEHPWSTKAGIDDYWRKNLKDMSEKCIMNFARKMPFRDF